MPSTWLDTTIITIVIAVGAVIFYRALKEPFDLLFSLIGKAIGGIRDKVSGAADSGYEVIHYG